VSLVVAFNAGHWVEPSRGIGLPARALVPGGTVAIAWTEVVSWGRDPFARALSETTGGPFPVEPFAEYVASIEPLRADARFGPADGHRSRLVSLPPGLERLGPGQAPLFASLVRP
jgi:hypothetical protein